MLRQGSRCSGLPDLRLALALLLVSSVVKEASTLGTMGGPGTFVQMLEDDDARMRHAAASFLQVRTPHMVF